MLSRSRSLLAALPLLAVVAACGTGDATGSSGADGAAYSVKAGDTTCDVQPTNLPAGPAEFTIENVGSDVTEVYVYAKAGDAFTKVVAERENIGPSTSQKLKVDLAAGEYEIACKPGMRGDGIRTPITVTGAGGATSSAAEEGYDRELELVVDAAGKLEPPPALTAKAGERIEFKLENESATEHHLKVLGPDGAELGEAEAQAQQTAEFIASLAAAGDYQVKIYPADAPADAMTLTLTVTG